MTATVSAIFRYPVKGLSGESLQTVSLQPGECLPSDRRFAIAHGSTRFRDDQVHWLSKQNFLMLAKDEKLAQLRVAFDEAEETLTLFRDGKQVVKAKVGDIMGRTLIGQFFASFMAGSQRGTPKLVEAEGVAFTDEPDKCLSFINHASIKDLERVARQPIDPRRFRGNVYLDGLAPWAEFDWVGRKIAIGDSVLEVVMAIERCAATNVNPDTAERDMNLPLTLRKGFSHLNMGVLGRVVEGGVLTCGAEVEILPA